MSRRMPVWMGAVLALAVAGLFAALGAWQLGRMHAKDALLQASAQVLEHRRAQPLALAADPARRSDYDWAAGPGLFLPGPAVLLDNQNHAGRAGVRAYRVFKPAAGGLPLLVELGWLPLPGDRQLPDIVLPDVDEVSGLLLPPPSRGMVASVLEHDDARVLATVLDLPGLASALQLPALAPRVLRLDPALPVGYARDLELLPNTLTPERHLGYAVQWFALAVAVLVVALVTALRSRRRR